VFESYSLFFYQIFSSQIISKTRKTCRRTKGNLLPLLQESPQVFGIARLSEVTTIQISHQKNPTSWVEQAKKEQSRDSRALSKGKGGVAGLFAGSVCVRGFTLHYPIPDPQVFKGSLVLKNSGECEHKCMHNVQK